METLNLHNSYRIILFLIILAFIVKGIFIFLTFSYNSFLKGRLLVSLKKRLFYSYSKMSFEYFLKNNIGDLTNIINEQVNLSVRAFNSLYTVGLRSIYCIIYLIFAYSISGISSFIAIIGSFIIIYFFFGGNIN